MKNFILSCVSKNSLRRKNRPLQNALFIGILKGGHKRHKEGVPSPGFRAFFSSIFPIFITVKNLQNMSHLTIQEEGF
ncbi:hypothetical protein HQ45_00690 [Porphyromonas crevioricanis]|nr:hypothetical protein HQ45_00690 [Porphyromonas crevioricanis]